MNSYISSSTFATTIFPSQLQTVMMFKTLTCPYLSPKKIQFVYFHFHIFLHAFIWYITSSYFISCLILHFTCIPADDSTIHGSSSDPEKDWFHQGGMFINSFKLKFWGRNLKKRKKARKKVKVAQFCPTLCNPMDYTVYRILQASILEWVSFFSSPGALPNSRIKPRSPRSPALQVDSLPAEPQGKPGIKNHYTISQKCYMDWWKFCSLITFLLSCVLQLQN